MPFKQTYNSDNRSFCLHVTIKCKDNTKRRFRAWAEASEKRNTKYADRDIFVEGTRTIYFSFPVSPVNLFLGIVNVENPQDDSFEVVLLETPVKSYNIDISESTKRFLKLAVKFSQVCGYETGTPQGCIFKTDTDEFKIKFFDVIRDRLTSAVINTPARIGHSTGIIEVSKAKFDSYTIPMRLIILLHEYSHKYMNPKIGLEISNEVGADINALYLYLGLGFSRIDAITVFCKVFYGAQSEGNRKRIFKITDYIKRFSEQEFAQLN